MTDHYVAIRWRNHPSGKCVWHDFSKRDRVALGIDVITLDSKTPNIRIALACLKQTAYHFMSNHTEADAVLIETSWEQDKTTTPDYSEEARINLRWFLTRESSNHAS